jgi:fucose permease
MASIGALYAVYGPAVSGFQDRFGIDDGTAGVGFAVQSAGAIAGVLLAPRLALHRGNRAALGASMLLVFVGSLAIALAATWPQTVAAAAVAGLGMGGCDVLISQLLILGGGARGPALVNVAHGFFGIGTVLAPTAVAAFGADDYRLVFALIAAAAVPGLVTVRHLWDRPSPAEAVRPGPSRAHTTRDRIRARVGLSVLAGFVLLYVTHFGVQSGIGTWEPTLLEALGHDSSRAALLTSGFWLAMVVGRFTAAGLTRFITIPGLVMTSCGLMTVCVLVAAIDELAAPAFVCAGFFIGPIFPSGLTWLASSGHAHGNRFAIVMAASMVGMAIPPWLLGLAIQGHGPTVMPLMVSAIAAAAFIASAVLYKVSPLRSAPGAGQAHDD